jgi:DNA-binding transcriptional LysR family regulator
VVRLGAAELVAVSWLPALVAAIHNRYPGLRLELDVSLTVELAAKLRNGDLDIALIPGSRFDVGLVSHSLGHANFVWMASPLLDMPDRTLTAADIRRWPILSHGEHSYLYETIEQWLRAHGNQRPRVHTCNNMNLTASLTAMGLGVSLLPPACYRSEIESGKLRVLETYPEGPDLAFSAVYPRRRPTAIPQLIASVAVETSTLRRRGTQ